MTRSSWWLVLPLFLICGAAIPQDVPLPSNKGLPPGIHKCVGKGVDEGGPVLECVSWGCGDCIAKMTESSQGQGFYCFCPGPTGGPPAHCCILIYVPDFGGFVAEGDCEGEGCNPIAGPCMLKSNGGVHTAECY